jgi:5-formyltetrahydrofolate cyclo-ligase
VTLGVAFAIQVVDEIPIAPHDRRVDALVTESEFSRLAPGDRFDEPS